MRAGYPCELLSVKGPHLVDVEIYWSSTALSTDVCGWCVGEHSEYYIWYRKLNEGLCLSVRTLWGAGRERVWGLCWDGAGAGGIGCGYGYGWDADMKFSQLVN